MMPSFRLMMRRYNIHRIPIHEMLACLCLFLSSEPSRADLSPECLDVEVPADYSEAKQAAFLQNYFSAAFSMSSMGPVLPYSGLSRAGEKRSAGLSLELLGIPPLSCQQRLAYANDPSLIKTQDANQLPLFARPRLQVMLPKIAGLSSMLGATFFPPILTPAGTVMQVGAEASLGYESKFGLQVGVHGHFSMARMRAEIAAPLVDGEPAVEDLFMSSFFGLDLGAAYAIDRFELVFLRPYLNLGWADASTLFVVGDDLVVAQNTQHPWNGLTASLGLQTLWLNKRLEVSAEFYTAAPLIYTGRAMIGVVW